MKKTRIFGLLTGVLAVGMVACNNEGEGSEAANDTVATTTENTTATTTTTTSDYSALADSARINSEAGNYLDPKTGKSIRISVDPQTGARTNAATGEPVWRYVDRRTWWVYGGDNWDTVGRARMDGNKIVYRDDADKWVDYDNRWKTDDEKLAEEWKKKYGDTKVKVSKDGDIKVKDESGKIKYDADDKKIKTDTSD